MNISLAAVVLLIAFILIYAILKRRKDSHEKEPGKKAKSNDRNEDDSFINLNEKFFASDRHSVNDAVIPLVRCYDSNHIFMIRSLLDSDGILSYVKSDSLNRLYPGVMVQGHTDTKIYIFQSDYSIAREITAEYIQSLLNGGNHPASKTVDTAALLFATPATSRNRVIPEIIEEQKENS